MKQCCDNCNCNRPGPLHRAKNYLVLGIFAFIVLGVILQWLAG